MNEEDRYVMTAAMKYLIEDAEGARRRADAAADFYRAMACNEREEDYYQAWRSLNAEQQEKFLDAVAEVMWRVASSAVVLVTGYRRGEDVDKAELCEEIVRRMM